MDLRKLIQAVPLLDRNPLADKSKYENASEVVDYEVKQSKGGKPKNGKSTKAKAVTVLTKLEGEEMSIRDIIAEKPKAKLVIRYLQSRIDQMIDDEDASDSD
jgi:hypothetical protein